MIALGNFGFVVFATFIVERTLFGEPHALMPTREVRPDTLIEVRVQSVE